MTNWDPRFGVKNYRAIGALEDEDVSANVIVMGPFERGKSNKGIFDGIIWVEEMVQIGAALKPKR